VRFLQRLLPIRKIELNPCFTDYINRSIWFGERRAANLTRFFKENHPLLKDTLNIFILMKSGVLPKTVPKYKPGLQQKGGG
jgi:hypothetical protein